MLGSIEENEWKMGVIGFHPRRRHWNADRIMEQMYRRLPGWAINSRLEDPSHEVHFSRCDNKEIRGQPIHIEIGMCRQFDGHYLDVADAVWRDFINDDFKTKSGTTVHVKVVRLNLSSLRVVLSNWRFAFFSMVTSRLPRS